MSEPILRRTPEDREQLTRALEELRQAEERLSLFHRHGHRLDATRAQEDLVEILRERVRLLRRQGAAA